MQNLRDFFQDSSSLYGSNASFIEELYEIFLENPELVESSWRDKFSQMHETADYEIAHSPIIERFAQLAQKSQGRLAKLQVFTQESVQKQSAVARLINHYRVRAHQIARNNPLGRNTTAPLALDPHYYGLSVLDMDTLFDTGMLQSRNPLPLHDIISNLERIYWK